jgi:TolB-like protein/DNA-binding SARP family transcriptional activator
MLYLRLFGGAMLEADGRPVSGPVTQRRRLALLALIAVPPGRSLARDKVIALLWPDRTAERGRHLLSESLYVIRKSLGEIAVITAGDELLLNLDVVGSDVGGFELAVEAGDIERAVALYSGPFLDGFYLGGTDEFERWAEAERARLNRSFQKALESLASARAAAGDLAGAVDAWHRLAEQDPYNSRVALGLIRALEADGDRAGAIQHARVHEVLLREEFSAEPDPDIAVYVERLRKEPLTGTISGAIGDAAAPDLQSPRRDDHPSEPGEVLAAAGHTAEGSGSHAARASARERGRRGPPATPRRQHGRLARRVAIPAGLALLLAIAGYSAIRSIRDHAGVGVDHPVGSPIAAERSVAVLPFTNLSGDTNNEYFADGLTEELILALARLQGVRVTARTSAFSFKGKDLDVREIGGRLGVRHVVEGSVRRAGSRLRISAQLVNVSDGYTVWSETYDRHLEDVFEVQDEISHAIVRALNIRLGRDETGPLVSPSTADLDAYTLYLQGRVFWNLRTPEGLALGMQRFQQALERDPEFARAYAGIADSYTLLVGYGALSPKQGYPRAKEAAERALALDSTVAEAHASFGLVKLYYEWDWPGAGAHLERALQLSPGNATVRQWYGHYLACRGQMDAAISQMQRAVELDPLSPVLKTAEGTVLYYARRYEDAISILNRSLEVDPTLWVTRAQLAAVYLRQGLPGKAIAEAAEAGRLSGGRHPLPAALLGYSYGVSGRRAEALEVLASIQDQATRQYVSPVYVAAIYIGLDDRASAFEWLEKAAEERDDWMVYLRADPAFDPLRSDPRFFRLLARVGP